MPDNGSMAGECDWKEALGFDSNGTGVDETTASNPTQYVYLVLYPVLLVCCTVGSVLTIATLWRDKSCRKSSASVYMICSAVGDLWILWSILPDYYTAAAMSLGNNPGDAEMGIILQYKGFGAFWNEAAIQFVDWTLIVFSIERLMVTLRPMSLQARTAATKWKKTLLVEFAVLVLAALFSLSYLVTYYYWLVVGEAYPDLTFQEVLTLPLRRWYLLQIDAEAGMFITKWIVLLILDIVLMTALWKYRQASKTMIATKKNSRSRNANFIVIGSLTLYMLTQFPYVVLQVLKIAARPPYCTIRLTNAQEGRARPIVNILCWSYYSVVFFIYILSSSKFREQFRALFGYAAKKLKRPQSGKSARTTVRRSISTDTVMTLANANEFTSNKSATQDDLENMTRRRLSLIKDQDSDENSL